MTRLARNLSRAALAFLSPALLVVILEGGARLLDLGYPTQFIIPFERDGEPVWADNQLFGYRFFNPAVSRSPAPIVVPRAKHTNEFRVVVLGESAAMGEPEPAYGPPRLLEYMLSSCMPDRDIRVINAAMTAINSHVIREIARDLKKLQPDAVVLYIGNNEVVGPYGPGTVFQSHAASPVINRMRVLTSRLRSVSALRAAWFHWKGGDDQVWKGMEMFSAMDIPPEDPRLRSVYRSYAQNMRAIIHEVARINALPVISTIAVNISNQAPFDGRPVEQTGVDGLKKLRDGDSLRFRADSRINRIIRETAAHFRESLLVDVEAHFESIHALGYPAFIDHVHFGLEGSYALTRLWTEAIAGTSTPPPSLEEITEQVVWNNFNAIDIAETMYTRSSRPPFKQTADHHERMMKWSREKARLYRTARYQPLDDILRIHYDRMAKHPRDLLFPQQAANALLMEDRFQEAGELLYRMHRMAPHRADIRGWMCVIAAIGGRSDRVWSIMTEGAPPLGQLPADMLISASETLMQSGYRQESLDVLTQVVERYPSRLRLQVLHASRLAQTGKQAEAKARFRDLIKKHGGENWISEEFAILLAMTGDISGAEMHLRHVQNSPVAEDRIKWVQLLVFQRRYAEAYAMLKSLVEHDDSFVRGWQMLAQISMMQEPTEASIHLLERLTGLEPWQGEYWLQLGQQYELFNRRDRAVAAYEKALPLLIEPDAALSPLARLGQPHDEKAITDEHR